jgi:uncharacterized damage-inducible protein DinB
MNPSAELSRHLKQVYFGGNWTSSNLRTNLADVSWQQAVTKVGSFNTIAALVFHIGYYIRVVAAVLEGKPLNASDKVSFDVPEIHSQQDWEELLAPFWTDAYRLAELIDKLPQENLGESFSDEKYGTYYRNLQGLIEHTHYHLGQIALLKKIIQKDSAIR